MFGNTMQVAFHNIQQQQARTFLRPFKEVCLRRPLELVESLSCNSWPLSSTRAAPRNAVSQAILSAGMSASSGPSAETSPSIEQSRIAENPAQFQGGFAAYEDIDLPSFAKWPIHCPDLSEKASRMHGSGWTKSTKADTEERRRQGGQGFDRNADQYQTTLPQSPWTGWKR